MDKKDNKTVTARRMHPYSVGSIRFHPSNNYFWLVTKVCGDEETWEKIPMCVESYLKEKDADNKS